MKILVIGGFLGSGKTTVVNKLLGELDARGLRVAVIENEIGTSGVDQAAMDQAACRVVPMFGGCVCCQLAGKFQDALWMLRDEVDPDWVVVELSGLALMKDMRRGLEPLAEAGVEIHMAGVADAARWEKLCRACPLVLENQLQNVDLILLNKTDLEPATEALLASVARINDEAPVVPVSARSAEPLFARMEEVWRDQHDA